MLLLRCTSLRFSELVHFVHDIDSLHRSHSHLGRLESLEHFLDVSQGFLPHVWLLVLAVVLVVVAVVARIQHIILLRLGVIG